MTNRPLSEQANKSAVQPMAVNPDNSDFKRSMEQYWTGLRTVTLPRITIQNVPANTQHSTASIPNVNPSTD